MLMRRSRWLVCMATVALIATFVIGCGSSSSSLTDTSESTSSLATIDTASSTTSAVVTTVAPAPNPQIVNFIDSSRQVVSNGQTISKTRALPTTVWRPSRAGVFPLVVFAHGYRLGPPGYARFCAALAEGGYIVAAPSFPLADESRGNGLNRDDIPHEALDVAFVIAALRSSTTGPQIAPGPVGVAGHSDGADVALIVGYQQDYADSGVGSVVAVAPDAFTGKLATNRPSLLLVHADSDATVPYSESIQVFTHVPGNRTFLTLIGADHLPPIAGNTVWTSVLDGAVLTFFDATLKNVQTLSSAQTLIGTLGHSKMQIGS